MDRTTGSFTPHAAASGTVQPASAPSSPAGVSQFRFSTDDFAPRQRLSAWREIFARTLVNIDVTPKGDQPFRSEATVVRLPGLDIMYGTASPSQAVHPQELIDADDLSVMIGPWRKWTASMLGREPELGAGDGVLMWNAYPGSMTLTERVPFVTFRVPCNAIRPLVTDLDATVARRIPAETEALQLLERYLKILREPALLGSPEVVRLAATHVYDLLAVALGATRDAAQIAEGRGLRATRLHAIKGSIIEELGRHDLSVVSVAARHRLTPRYVQILFEAEGTTFTEFLLAQRLARAHRMLSDPRFARRSITSIAFDTGFADLSYFDRSFRRCYGSTPTEVRRAGLHAR